MTDIQTRADLELLMDRFYARLLADDAINYLFTDVAQIDLQEHLPTIVDFWETVILHSGDYKKNVMQIHLDLNAKAHLTPEHFKTWLRHLNTAIDQNFSGTNAEQLKTRALSIGTVMQIKMQKSV